MSQTATPTPSGRTLRILLLGDSTVMGSVPRVLAPQADHLEHIVAKLLAASLPLACVSVSPPDLRAAVAIPTPSHAKHGNAGSGSNTTIAPRPTHAPHAGVSLEVINRGLDNDWIFRLLNERYDRELRSLPAPGNAGDLHSADIILVRYGLNDYHYLKNPVAEFPATYRELLARLRRDHPRAHIAMETVIPYCAEPVTRAINALIRQIAAAEGLPICDTHASYAAALERGPDMFNYRRAPLAAIPEQLHCLVPASCVVGSDVISLDHTLDAHFADVPNWSADRHSNLAGFHVIGKHLAGYLLPLVRERLTTAR